MGTILVIEDDQTLASSYDEVLTGAGHKIIKSADGQDALGKLQNQKFDLIITDLNMPKISGEKFISLLLEGKNAVSCPIIICSGHINSTIINSFSGHDQIHFLLKPSTLKELKAKVNELLQSTIQRTKIDVRFINPILSSTMEVISSMTQFSISVGKPYVKKSGERSGDISGLVGVVSSGFKGTISLSFSESGFLAVVSKMLMEEISVIDDENKDAVAELLNIIFGKAKTILNEAGMNIQPAIPSIIRGKNHTIEHHSQNQTIVIPYKCQEIGDFRAEVSSVG